MRRDSHSPYTFPRGKAPFEDLVFAVAREVGCPTAPLGDGWELTSPGRRAAGRRRSSLRLFSFEGEPFVRFTTRTGRKELLSPGRLEQALELNTRLPHGCLAIDAGDLVLTDTLPLGSATPAHAAAVLRFLAQQADLYESVLFGQDVD